MVSKKPRLEEGESLGNFVVEDSYDNQKDEDYEPEIQEISTKKKQLARVWSDEEEIAILNGCLSFSSEKGLDPFKNKTEFVDFMKESLVCQFTKAQLVSKLKRMKKKFKSILSKGIKPILEPHPTKVFELSEKIWGDAAAAADEPEPDLSLLCGNQMAFDLDETFSGLGEDILEEVMEKIGEADRAKFKEQWNELQVLELKLTLMRAQLVEFETKIILDAYQSSKMK